ncbi:hypothetical protein C5C18_00510 [Rathayibacter tritici]|uniref:hypothetical protein n=1 Tax=Rathayibacter tritici TaxID=33888 RepID=UPI0008323109|nr:hypothetical protein [Rathayibacter tritici]PPF67907.1 hypothetical protein C5C21_06060 [Rathayibacter tritici]PPG09501.1 hypothetical protein C5C18_00510 [Rathayibacter tritici]PPI43210.1 hypothetical protein C5D18_10015 [Rathayibacter tritici]
MAESEGPKLFDIFGDESMTLTDSRESIFSSEVLARSIFASARQACARSQRRLVTVPIVDVVDAIQSLNRWEARVHRGPLPVTMLPSGGIFALASLRRVLDNVQHSGETLDVVLIRFDEWEDVPCPTATLPLIEDVELETAARAAHIEGTSTGDERHPRGHAAHPGRFSTKPQSDTEGSLAEQSRPALERSFVVGAGEEVELAGTTFRTETTYAVGERVFLLIGPREKAY